MLKERWDQTATTNAIDIIPLYKQLTEYYSLT